MFGVALGLLAISGSVSADTKTLARAGSWEAFGGTTINGRGVCGVSAEPAGRYFGLKLFAGGTTFTIQMGTKEWKLENGTKLPLTLRFDNNSPWTATGTVFHYEDGDAGLQFTVKREEIDTFAQEFRASSTLRIQFENNMPAPWVLGLEGTMAVNSAFQNCMKSLK
jgi:hypothetical protein